MIENPPQSGIKWVILTHFQGYLALKNRVLRKVSKEVSMSHVSGHTHSQNELDYWADLHNPNSDVYQDDLDNHANQLNPNNDEYWHSRGMEKSGK